MEFRYHSGRSCGIRVFLTIVFSVFAAVLSFGQDAPAAGQMRLAKIEFQGLKTIKAAEAITASGLSSGQDVDLAAIDAAAERLMKSGLFRNLSYSVKGTSAAASVVFIVEESVRGVPIVYDNFVWFSDEELGEAVRKKLPGFDGTAPAGGGMAETIRGVLQDLLRSRKMEGVVEYILSTDAANRPEHLYTVKGAGLRVCELHYPGAGGVSEKELIENSSGIFNNEYTRTFAVNYVEAALLPMYRERGRLKASYRPPQVKPVSNADCENGVALTIPIEEGIIYTWEKAIWEGNHVLTTIDLDNALGMKRGEVANSKKIERGISKLTDAYGRKGHLLPSVQLIPEFNDSDRRVSYRLRINEGPLYGMGDLTITGLPEAESNNLRGRWRLLPKEVFDTGYPAEFMKTSAREFYADMQRAGTPVNNLAIDILIKPDHDTKLVNVTLTFKPLDPTKKP